jgi:single-strand DNA-binding protein
VGVDGRLDWREWEAQDGTKRQAVEIIAESVQFLGNRSDGEGQSSQYIPPSDVAADQSDFVKAGAGAAADDDIPF